MDKIQQIKDKYGQQAKDIIASGLMLEARGKKYRCPNSSAHKRGDRNPSMSWDPNAKQFYCFTCGMRIDMYGYYRDHLNYTHTEVISELLGVEDYKKTSMQQNRDKFTESIKKLTPLTSECIGYIEKRGITRETMERFSLRSYNGEIAFPYYKYETVVGYKRRKPKKHNKETDGEKMLSISGSKPYLFGVQNVEPGAELIICEGEFDCMVISQCGYENVVSVGAGANSMGALIEQASDFIDSFEMLIVVSDNDASGSNMDAKMLQTFGDKVKLIDKRLYTMNDINEELVKSGPEKIIEIIESARFKIEGRRDLTKNPYKGITKRPGNYIPTGIDTIDNAINDLAPGCVTLLTGRSNGGKTTFTKQIIMNAVDNGNKVYVVSGEGDQETFINELYQVVIGRDNSLYDTVKINKKYHKEPKPHIKEALEKWHANKLTLFNKGQSRLRNMNQLFQMIEYEIKINKFDLVVIDNLMSILSVQASEKLEAQADFLQRCHDLVEAYRTHIILVLHPNKTYQKGSDMDFEQISGTSDLANKADNILVVIREYDEDKIAQGKSGRIAVLKNRYYPELPACDTHFEKDTGLILEIDKNTRQCIAYNFHWRQYLDGKQGIMELEEIEKPDGCPF